MKFKVTKRVIELLEDAVTNSSVLNKITRSLFDKLQKELFQNEEKGLGCVSNVLDFLEAVQNLMRHGQGYFTFLDEAGLIELMSAIFEQILKSLADNGFGNDVQALIECCLETVNVIADSEPAAKTKVILALLIHFLGMLEHPALVFNTRMEVLKAMNMLLEQCPVQTKEKILDISAIQQKLTTLVNMFVEIGDYEFQVCVIECLMRLFPRKARQKYASMFILDAQMMEEFLLIRDKVFETDCRIFLNNINSRNDDPTKGVFSFPCASAIVGNKQLNKPDDPNYEEFWIDFNIGSMRITLFCEQGDRINQESQMEEGLWETLEICKSNVRKCSISTEKENDRVSLEINLKSSICQLYPSQHYSEQGDCITVEFVPELLDYVSHAVNQTFNFDEQKKSKVSIAELPLHISIKDLDLHEESTKKSREQIEQRLNRAYDFQEDSYSQSSGGKKKKVSVPTAPLQLFSNPVPTPVPSAKSEMKKSEVTESAKSKSVTAPKTPTKCSKSKVKVKTPVVEIGSSAKKDKSTKRVKNNRKKEMKSKDKNYQDDIIIKESQSIQNEVKDTVTAKVYQSENQIDTQNNSLVCPDGNKKVDKSKEKKIDVNKGEKDNSNKPKPKVSICNDGSPEKSAEDNSDNGFPQIDDDSESEQNQEMITGSQEQVEERSNSSQERVLKNDFSIFQKGAQLLSQSNFGFDDLEDIDRVPETIPKNSDKDMPDDNEQSNTTHGEVTAGLKKSNRDNNTEQKSKPEKKKKTSKCGKKQSYTDVDKSLKELCDLDKRETCKKLSKITNKGTKAVTESTFNEERKCLSQEEVEQIYTFHDPEEEFDSFTLTQTKKYSYVMDSSEPYKQLGNKEKNKKKEPKQKKRKGSNDDKKCLDVLLQKKANKIAKKATSYSESKTETENMSNETKYGRSLRSRKTKPNYKDIIESDESIWQSHVETNDNVEGKSTSEIGDISHHDDTENNCLLFEDVKRSKKAVFSDNYSKRQKTKKVSAALVGDSESKMVTVNSDESDTDMPGAAPIHEEHDSAMEESIESRDEEECGTSLYVESDDSSNARNYNMNYRDRKRRRSSIRKRDSIKKKLSDKSNWSTSRTDKKINEEGKEGKKSKCKGKNVSFEDSVLKDTSLVKQQHPTTDVRKKPSIIKGGKENIEECISIDDSLLNDISPIKTQPKDDAMTKGSFDEKGKKNDKSIRSKKYLHENTRKATVSYAKDDGRWNKIQKLQTNKPGAGYDPFDFDAQTDNTSNASERIGRLDVSKELNKKYGRKSIKGNEKTKSKSKKDKTSEYESIDVDIDVDVCNNEDIDEETSKQLMVQDSVTKRWHRSNDYKDKQCNGKANQKSNEPVAAVSVNSSPVQSVSSKQSRASEESDLYIEKENAFKNILNDIRSNRQDRGYSKVPITGYDEKCENVEDFEQIVCISPIRTPYLSAASTPKVTSGRRKQYTPLSISVIKTPQSATPGEKKSGSYKYQFDHDLSEDNERVVDSLQNSEKSWIKSKMKDAKTRKKTPVTYKCRKKQMFKTYPRDESGSESGSRTSESSEPNAENKPMRQKRAVNSIKTCKVSLKDMMIENREKEEETETESQSADTSTVVTGVSCNPTSQNLDQLILSPYTPVKSECFRVNPESDIDVIQTQEDHLIRLSAQDDCDDDDDGDDDDPYDTKYRRQTLLGDSGFHSGPSSAVRDASLHLKRKYPEYDETNIVEDNNSDSEDDLDQRADDNPPFIPKKLFRLDPSVNEKRRKIEDLRSCTDASEQSTSSNFGFNTCENNSGFTSFLNSFGIDVRRQMERKREQVDAFTKQAVRELQKHHSQSWVVQQQYRSNVDVDFKTKMMLELEGLERDIDLLKEAGQKTTDVYKYQLDVLNTFKSRQISSLTNMKGLQVYLKEKSRKVDKHNRNLQSDLKQLLKKDVMTLQRRLLEQTQKEELTNIKRNLQRTFSTSMTW